MTIIVKIQDLKNYIARNPGFSENTVGGIIQALRFPKKGSGEPFRKLSGQLESIAEYGVGVPGFCYYSETIPFFKKHARILFPTWYGQPPDLPEVNKPPQCFHMVCVRHNLLVDKMKDL
jgi:hypothetical protein